MSNPPQLLHLNISEFLPDIHAHHPVSKAELSQPYFACKYRSNTDLVVNYQSNLYKCNWRAFLQECHQVLRLLLQQAPMTF